jgi:general secretion pathway protein B
MSFILDALKKSESERQRQQGPGLMDSGISARRRRLPAWAIIICVLLGINVVILAVMLLRQRTPAAPAPAPAPAPANVVAASTPSRTHFSPLDSGPVYAPEIPVDQPEPGAGSTVQGAPASRGQRSESAAPDSGAQDDEILPDISQVTLAGGQTLPDLHLDVHVYATRAADRFVYINMRKYREGAVLAEGLNVEHIRRDGVVLNYQGVRFLLPRH